MADDSIDIIEPFEFHPCDSPRGMLYYDLNILTGNQQIELNDLKRKVIRENERYLASHPEVRAVIALATRYILRIRPRNDVQEHVGHFFSRPKPDIQEEIRQYIEAREPHVYEGDSAVIIREESSEGASEAPSGTIEEEPEEEENLESVPRKVLSEILLKAYERLGIDVDDTDDWVVPPEIPDADGTSVVKKVISEVLEQSSEDSFDFFDDILLSEKESNLRAPPGSEISVTTIETDFGKALEEQNEEIVEEPKQEVVEVIEIPKPEVVEEPKQNLEQSEQAEAAVEVKEEEAVVSSEQPPVEEPTAPTE